MEQSDNVGVAIDSGVLTLRISRPEKKNALTGAMYQRLAEALESANRDPAVRVVLIEGDGADFCAGNDIVDFVKMASAGAGFEHTPVLRFLRALVMLECPMVAAVRGRAIGIGFTLLLHCDLVYVAVDAKLTAPFVDLALVPEAASSCLLPARLGHARAFAVFALGESIGGEAAMRAGIANAALPSNSVETAARSAAIKLAVKPLQALRATKALMRPREQLLTVVDAEVHAFAQRLVSAEAQAVFSAFMSRGAPKP